MFRALRRSYPVPMKILATLATLPEFIASQGQARDEQYLKERS
jgi:hypothetical protein